MARETMSIASGMKLFCMVDFVYNVDIDMAQCLERYDAPIICSQERGRYYY
jgi:hypothetical protein